MLIPIHLALKCTLTKPDDAPVATIVFAIRAMDSTATNYQAAEGVKIYTIAISCSLGII
jgi:hypothetical protein